MKLPVSLFAACLLAAVAAPAAWAAPVTAQQSITLQPGKAENTLTAPISKVHTVAGEFVDTYVFTGIDRWAMVNGSLTTIGMSNQFDIDFVSAALNGVNYSFSRSAMGANADALEVGKLLTARFSGPLVLEIRGVAGQGLAAGTAISASYSGTLNVTQVPEPGSLALAAFGLAGAAVTVRRRRSGAMLNDPLAAASASSAVSNLSASTSAPAATGTRA